MMLDSFVKAQKELLDLERNEEILQSKVLGESSPKVLEEKGLCIRKVSITNICTGLHGKTVVEFKKDLELDIFSKKVFSQGDIVGIFVEGQLNEEFTTSVTGVFCKQEKSSMHIIVDKDDDKEILLENFSKKYRLIKLTSDVTYSRLKIGLEYLEKRTKRFCGDYLVDLLLDDGNPIDSIGQLKDVNFINDNLNESQKEAVKFALSRQDIAIIHGPPGTGKTTVAVEILLQMLQSGSKDKVLVCTPSNIALDNIAEKLCKAMVKFKGKHNSLLRLGHSARVMSHLTNLSLDYKLSISDQAELIRAVKSEMDEILRSGHKLEKQNRVGRKEKRVNWRQMSDLRKELKCRELKAVKEILSQSKIILSTLTGLRSNKCFPLDEVEFDTVLIDEASQALEMACWLAIPRGKKLILAGDHKQLPPTILSERANKEGLGLTLMERILKNEDKFPKNDVCRMLSVQYRMHEDIMKWSSCTFYDDLLVADKSVEKHLLRDLFIDPINENGEESPVAPLVFIDTSGCGLQELKPSQESLISGTNQKSDESKGNAGEAQLAAVYIRELVSRFQSGRNGCDGGGGGGRSLTPDDIGIITPYNRQVQLIRQSLDKLVFDSDSTLFNVKEIEVSTVDGFQGREKQVIIITLVRSNFDGNVGFLSEHRRLNVALTRAQRHLCVIGDSSTILQSNDKVLKKLIEYWNSNADVHSAYEYIYDYDISPGNCVVAKSVLKMKNNVEDKKNADLKEKSDKKLKKMIQKIKKYKDSADVNPIEFDPNLNSYQRAQLHEFAEKCGLNHKSTGEGDTRRLTVYKSISSMNVVNEAEEIMLSNDLPTTATSLEQTDQIVKSDDNSDDSDRRSENENENECQEILPDNPEVPIVEAITSESNVVCTDEFSQSIMTKSNQLKEKIEEKNKNKKDKITKSKKKANNKKMGAINQSEIPDDLDEMLEHFQNLDKYCQFSGGGDDGNNQRKRGGKKCGALVTVVGFTCRWCGVRFCSSHVMPEVHGCDKSVAPDFVDWRRESASAANDAVRQSQSRQLRHNQLSRAVNHRLTQMAADRQGSVSSETASSRGTGTNRRRRTNRGGRAS